MINPYSVLNFWFLNITYTTLMTIHACTLVQYCHTLSHVFWEFSIPGYPVLSWDVPGWQANLGTSIFEYLVSQVTQYYPEMCPDDRLAWTPNLSTILGCPWMAGRPGHLNLWILSISGYPVLSWDVPRWQVSLNTTILEYLVSQDTQYYPEMSSDGRSAWTLNLS